MNSETFTSCGFFWGGITLLPPNTKQCLTQPLAIPLSPNLLFEMVKLEPLVFNFFLEPLKMLCTLAAENQGKSTLHTDLLPLINSPQTTWAGQQVQVSLAAPTPALCHQLNCF